LYGPLVAGALAAADFVLGGAREDDTVADAGSVVGVIGMVVDSVEGGMELPAGASLSANDAPLDGELAGELAGGVLTG
jgi:hypothetical protein